MIEAFRVGAVSRGRPLWEGLTFAVRYGEMWVIAGPPSCGKTLLMQFLRGEKCPDSGDVVVAGESIYRGSPDHHRRFRASCGVVPESLPGEGVKTVTDLFRLSALAAAGLPAAETEGRMEALLSLVGLPGAEGWEISSLSGSERARVALAVELFRSPRYLFLDMLLEKTGKEWADKLGSLLRALAREEKTIIMMERELPDRWKGAKTPPSLSAGPFRLYRLVASSPDRKEEAGDPPSQGGSSLGLTGGRV
jgi:ABC-type multidrug transport system ATPase subunit